MSSNFNKKIEKSGEKMKYNVGEISKMLNVSPFLIKKWERQNLIKFDRGDNNYRKIDAELVPQLTDIKTLRDINISAKEIKKFFSMSLNEEKDFFSKIISESEKKIAELQEKIEFLKLEQELILLTLRLKDKYEISSPPFDFIVAKQSAPSKSNINCFKVNDWTMDNRVEIGFAADSSIKYEKNEILWEKSPEKIYYVTALPALNDKLSETFRERATEELQYFKSLGFSVSSVFATGIALEKDYTYLQTYFETEKII